LNIGVQYIPTATTWEDDFMPIIMNVEHLAQFFLTTDIKIVYDIDRES
jgi:hypothetical protein